MSEPRRRFTVEFKKEAVQMVVQQGLSVAEAARRLDIGPKLLRKWRDQLGETGRPSVSGPGQPTALEAENRQLREENSRLRMERDILKKATVFFAKESK
jgi:transposase